MDRHERTLLTWAILGLAVVIGLYVCWGSQLVR